MPISKVVFGDQTLIDITDSTIASGDLRTGCVAYDKAGNRIIGSTDWTMTVSNGSVSKISGTTDDYLLTLTQV